MPLPWVPMKLPCTRFCPALTMRRPAPWFPEIRFRARSAVPPTRLLLAPDSIRTPLLRLASTVPPVMSVPM